MNLNPQEESEVSLTNASWVFILAVLKQQQAAVFVDNGQEGLITLLSNKLIEANKNEEKAY